ncbi:MAG: hypothetical protein ABH823_02720, partial [bacterium]
WQLADLRYFRIRINIDTTANTLLGHQQGGRSSKRRHPAKRSIRGGQVRVRLFSGNNQNNDFFQTAKCLENFVPDSL